jgi:hypothetical protein
VEEGAEIDKEDIKPSKSKNLEQISQTDGMKTMQKLQIAPASKRPSRDFFFATCFGNYNTLRYIIM